MKEAIFLGHLGMGDHLVKNGLVRALAKDRSITVLCKQHNAASCTFMWRDNPNITVLSVTGTAAAVKMAHNLKSKGVEAIYNGLHKFDNFDMRHWDQEFYRHAGVPFEQSWYGFKVDRDLKQERTVLPVQDYAFIHDDPERGCHIDNTRIDPALVRFRPDKLHPNIFTWCKAIEHATAIHCMESCFAILADRIPTTATRLCIHAYARKSIAPTYKKAWEILT